MPSHKNGGAGVGNCISLSGARINFAKHNPRKGIIMGSLCKMPNIMVGERWRDAAQYQDKTHDFVMINPCKRGRGGIIQCTSCKYRRLIGKKQMHLLPKAKANG